MCREAAGLLCNLDKQQEAFSRQRMFQILQGNAKSVMWEPRHMTTARKTRGKAPDPMPRISSGLQAYAARMQYNQYLKAIYPSATGVIEGAYRHLV